MMQEPNTIVPLVGKFRATVPEFGQYLGIKAGFWLSFSILCCG